MDLPVTTDQGNFSIAYICVMVASILPYIWVAIAKFGSNYDNRQPRAQASGLTGWRARANWAQLNAFEALAPFSIAIVLARIEGAPAHDVAIWAVLFLAFRVVHGLLYIYDKATLRSLAWFGGVVCVTRIFLLAI